MYNTVLCYIVSYHIILYYTQYDTVQYHVAIYTYIRCYAISYYILIHYATLSYTTHNIMIHYAKLYNLFYSIQFYSILFYSKLSFTILNYCPIGFLPSHILFLFFNAVFSVYCLWLECSLTQMSSSD